MLDAEREQVADAARALAAAGLVIGTAGNVSVRNGEHVAITPTGAALAALTAEQVAVIDLDGNQLAGALAPTSELDLHLGAYRRYDSAAVVHTHAPAATALACVCDELPVVHYGLLGIGGAIRVAPYATFGTPELAQATLDALEGKMAVLMANHGTLTLGLSAEHAVQNTLLLEWGCELYARARALGTPKILSEAEQADVVRAVVARKYGTPVQA